MKTFLLGLLFVVASCKQQTGSEAVSQHSKPLANQDSGQGEALAVKTDNTGAPFNTLDYDRAVAYDYDSNEENIIDNKGGLHPGVVKKSVLTPEQTAEITDILSDNDTYGGDGFKCFEPQLGLVFYKGDKVVMHISVCLSCNYLHSSIDIPAESSHEDADGGGFGFSKSGSVKIFAFAKALGFR